MPVINAAGSEASCRHRPAGLSALPGGSPSRWPVCRVFCDRHITFSFSQEHRGSFRCAATRAPCERRSGGRFLSGSRGDGRNVNAVYGKVTRLNQPALIAAHGALFKQDSEEDACIRPARMRFIREVAQLG